LKIFWKIYFVSLVVVKIIRRFGFGPIHQPDCDYCGSLGCRSILQYSRVILFDRFWYGPIL